MSENFKNIELIELYLEAKLSEEERIAFENRLLIEDDLKEEFELYKLSISVIKENYASSLQEELNLLDKKLDRELNLQAIKNNKQFPLKRVMGIAASILIIVGFSLYLFSKSENERLYSKYYIKDNGLPVTMSVSNNSLNTVMNFYKLGETDKAYTEISKFSENDTVIFYKAVFLLELNKNSEANILFNRLPQQSVFKQKAQYYYALSLLVANKKEESKKVLQVIINTKNHKYLNQVNKLLQEEYLKK